jgi:carbohydrate kinase (thermoresistant glucokinase family)
MQASPVRVVIVMGVSGSGKTTVGALLAGHLDWAFADADDFHDAAQIAKMHGGVPLDDADRMPWLAAIAAQIDRWRNAGQHAVVACSALKRSYRDILIGPRTDVRLVYLRGDRELIGNRLTARTGHFMPAALLESQFGALEEPSADEHAITIDLGPAPAAQVEAIARAIGITLIDVVA